MKIILTVVGTRPEAIKMAPVIGALRRSAGSVHALVCATGQHRQMLDQALGLFGIVPDFDLDVMRSGQDLSGLTARLLDGLDAVIVRSRPDWILAQGDTTTVLASALAAFHRRIRFGHVEAGLRTGDLDRPFPEEANRRVADMLATARFAPTERAARELRREGYPPSSIHMTGNTIVDALLDVSARPYDWSAGPLAGLPLDRRLVLLTTHRRESFGPPLERVCAAVRELATRFADQGIHIVCPVHLNPAVQSAIGDNLSGLPNVSLVEPLDYLSIVHLMKRCALILTDSGGIQEEAAVLRVPTLVLRSTTERREGVDAGLARLVGTDGAVIVREASRVLSGELFPELAQPGVSPYGDGLASGRIADVVLAG